VVGQSKVIERHKAQGARDEKLGAWGMEHGAENN